MYITKNINKIIIIFVTIFELKWYILYNYLFLLSLLQTAGRTDSKVNQKLENSSNALWEIRNGLLSNLLFSPYSDVTVELPLTLMHPKPKGKQAPSFLIVLAMATASFLLKRDLFFAMKYLTHFLCLPLWL